MQLKHIVKIETFLVLLNDFRPSECDGKERHIPEKREARPRI